MITLKNFQGHADSSLDVVRPGINVLVGKSRAGKSAIVRGIEALCGQGPMYRRRGSKETRVEWNDCARIRSNTKNEYEVAGTVYKAMRSDTPKELQDRLRLSAINFRPQHQPYFLLADSPGAVAREMNKLADLGMIDYVVGNLKKSLKDTEDEIKTAGKNASRLQEKIASFDWAVAAEADLKKIEEAQDRQTALVHEVLSLDNAISEVESLEEKLARMPPTPTDWIDHLEARLVTTPIENLARTIGEIEEIESWLASLPPDMSKELAQVSGRVTSAIDPAPLQRVCEELAELEYELALVPDIGADITALDAIAFPSGLSELSAMVDALESLPDYSGFGEWEVDIERPTCKMEELAWFEREVPALQGMITMHAVHEEACRLLWEERHHMEMEFEELLTEAGVCPLCLRGVE